MESPAYPLDGEPVPFSAFAEDAPTGSLVFWRGASTLSTVVRIAEQSAWSHVGLVVQPSDLGHDGEALLLWECTNIATLPDVLRGESKTGPQVVDLGARLKGGIETGRDHGFAFRRFSGPALTDEARAALRAYVDEAYAVDFPSHAEAAVAYLKQWLWLEADDEETLCTRLTAETLQRTGLMRPERAPNGYAIHDYEPGGAAEAALVEGASWGPLTPLAAPEGASD